MKKYRMTIGDQSLIVGLEEIVDNNPQPNPQPQPQPEPKPDTGHDHHDNGIEITDTHIVSSHDRVPRFAAQADSIAINNGSWLNANTWRDGKVPTSGSKVQIPHGVTVTYDIASKDKIESIEIDGHLIFAPSVDTEMWVSEITVLPAGVLTIRPENVKSEIVFFDSPLKQLDETQAGKGLLVFGKVDINGFELNKTFVRVAEDIRAGASTVRLTEEVNWHVGSLVVFPDTRHINPVSNPKYYTYKPQWEVRTVVKNENGILTLDSPLEFAHKRPRNMDGSLVRNFDGNDIAPHVGNLSRSIVIRSENPNGTRGHVQCFGAAHVNIRFAEFRDLGRTTTEELDSVTNRIGRYSLHCHHLVGRPGGINGHQFVIEGNSVTGGLKWGITVHASHFGLIKGNVVYNVDGAGIATENASETGNLFEGNFVCRVNGDGILPPLFNGLGEQTEKDSGNRGDGLWFAGPMNSVRNNVVANAYRSAYTVWPEEMPHHPDSRAIKPVLSPVSPLGEMRTVNILQEAFKDFVGNEAYGATTSAVQLWGVGDRRLNPSNDPNEINTLLNTTVWNVIFGVRYYYADSYRVHGWIQRGDPLMIGKTVEDGIYNYPSRGEAMTHSGSLARFSDSCDVDIEGYDYGYIQRGHGFTTSVELCDAILNNKQNIEILSWAQLPSDSVYKDIMFLDTYSPGSLRAIKMSWEPFSEQAALSPETHTVINYQRLEGLDLDLYYYEQAPGAKPALVPEGKLPKGRLAPTHLDNDNGEAAKIRGKAMGIEGLVFAKSKPEKPQLFCNVLLENDRPTLYFAVIGNVTNPVVTVNFGGKETILSGKTGSLDLGYVIENGLHPLKVKCSEATSVFKQVAIPVKK